MAGKFTSVFCIVLSFCASLRSFAQTENPNPGPRSTEESVFLYNEGAQALLDKNYVLASKDFERFVARYPSSDKIQGAYLKLMESLFNEKRSEELVRYAREFLNLKTDIESANRVRAYLAESQLNLHHTLDARLAAEELLKNAPPVRQRALALAVQFQSLLEEKQYSEAHRPLDELNALVEKEPIDPYVKLMPEFKMTLLMRECVVSHLLKNKNFTDEEILGYFGQKNLCFKSALPHVATGVTLPALQEWCEEFTFLNHELQKLKIDPFLKEKVQGELKSTFDFAQTLSPELTKCYEPYKPPVKNKKRHRKRRLHKP